MLSRYCSKCCSYINIFNLHSNLIRWASYCPHFIEKVVPAYSKWHWIMNQGSLTPKKIVALINWNRPF